MRECLNENTLFNTVAMLLDEVEGLYLVLEGPHDHLLLEGFQTTGLHMLPASGGRPQVLSAARLALDRGLSRARFLVDRDYDRFSGSTEADLENVFVTDHHDCFLDLLYVDRTIMRRVIDVHCATARRNGNQTLVVPKSQTIEEEAFGLGSKLAAARVVDAQRGLNLDFKRFKFGEINPEEFDVEDIAKEVLIRNRYSEDDFDEIVSDISFAHAEILAMDHSPIGDHDFFRALAKVMQKYGAYIKDGDLQRSFILKVTWRALSGTGWYRSVQRWCEIEGVAGFTYVPDAPAA